MLYHLYQKKRLLHTILLCCIMLTTSCQKQNTIELGLVLDLTGRASEIGVSGRNGAVLAANTINSYGGINGKTLNLIIKDDKGDPQEAIKVDGELIKQDVILTIGHVASGTGLEGLKVFQQHNKLMISPTMSTVSLSGIDDNFFRIIDSNDKQGKILAGEAIKRTKKAAILFEETNKAFSYELSQAFKSDYISAGGSIVYEQSFTSCAEAPLKTYAQQIIASGADGVLIVAGGLDLALLTQYIKKEKSHMEIFSGMWAMTGDLIENGGKAIEGLYLAGIYDKGLKKKEFIEFRDNYIRTFNCEPTFSSVYHYETVMLVAEVLKQSKKTDTESLKKTILNLGTFKGLNNDFKIDRFGDTARGYDLFKVTNGEFIRKESV